MKGRFKSIKVLSDFERELFKSEIKEDLGHLNDLVLTINDSFEDYGDVPEAYTKDLTSYSIKRHTLSSQLACVTKVKKCLTRQLNQIEDAQSLNKLEVERLALKKAIYSLKTKKIHIIDSEKLRSDLENLIEKLSESLNKSYSIDDQGDRKIISIPITDEETAFLQGVVNF